MTTQGEVAAPDGRLPVPFIVGSGRSGTTLLRSMIDAHPEVAVPPESPFVAALARERRFRRGPVDVRVVVDRLRADPRFQRWHVDPAAVLLGGSADRRLSLAEILRLLYQTYAAAHGKSRWGDKTPSTVLNMSAVSAVLPEARFIHIIRDGREVAASLLEVDFGPNDARSAASWWRRDVARGRRCGADLGSDRYLETRYEALVDDPDRELRRICDFIEVEFCEAMIHDRTNVDRILADSARPSQHHRISQPVEWRAGAWERLDRSDQRAVLRVQGSMLARLGYVDDGPRPWGRVSGAASFGRVESARLLRRVVAGA